MNEKQWAYLRVVGFAIAAFVFNTTEYVPIALLSSIGHSFAMKEQEVGQMISIYAWVVALASLPLMLLTAKLERKKLLLLLLLSFFISHVVSALAVSFELLVLSRVGVALSHAIFWAIAAPLAVRVAPAGQQTLAVSLVAMGSGLAAIVGVPLGRIIGDFFGWRVTFAILAMGSMALLLLMALLLPTLKSTDAGSARMLPILMKRPALVGFFILTALSVSAHFMAYSYIEPFALQITRSSSTEVAYLLLAFGLSGIVGSMLFQRYFDRYTAIFVFASLGVIIVPMLLLATMGTATWGLFILLSMWGIGVMGFTLSYQLQVMRLANDATDMALSIFSGIYNAGIAIGTTLGASIIDNGSMKSIGYYAAALCAVALLWLWLMWRRYLHNK